MNSKTLTARNIVFWALITVFAILLPLTFTGLGRLWGPKLLGLCTLAFLAITLLALAAALVALTVKLKETRMRKLFFLLTGASAIAIPICVVLHNLVYGLFIRLFGEGFWGNNGDEAVFFILAVLVFPALFVIGALGSVVLFIKSSAR